jgi:broad specificity phosphatase PhoE
MRLYIIRHADPDYEHDTITAAGHLEAQALARRMAGYGLTHLYVSPITRARLTAQYTADTIHLEPVIQEWMRELSGLQIALPDPEIGKPEIVAWDLPGEMLRRQAGPLTHDNWHTVPELSAPAFREAEEQVRQQSDAFLARHGYVREGRLYRRVQPNQDQIAAFCHNGLGLTWLAHLLDIPLPLFWTNFWLAPSSVTTILFEERSASWAVPRCLSLGDTSHLYAAELPVLPRGLKGNIR